MRRVSTVRLFSYALAALGFVTMALAVFVLLTANVVAAASTFGAALALFFGWAVLTALCDIHWLLENRKV
jgi:uncharacterized membrane-anchored protein YitT (DUF2179 family)